MAETYWCEACEAYVEPSQVVQLGPSEGRTRIPSCPRCRRHVRLEVQHEVRPLARVLAEGALWPLSAHAAPAILASSVFVYVLWRYAGLFGVGPLLSTAAVLLQAATIVRASAAGEEEMPAPREVAGWDDVAGTLMRYLLVLGVGVVPAIAGLVLTYDLSPGAQNLATLAGAALGALYLPAALVRAATSTRVLSAIEPVTPLRIAWRMGAPYFVGVAATWLTAAAWLVATALATALARALDAIPLVPGITAISVGVCGLFAVARVLGLLVREHRDEVGLDV